MSKFGTTIQYKLIKSRPDIGSFALESNPYRWDSCRETFASKFKEDTTGIFYCHQPQKSKDIAAFIARTEHILKINDPTQYSLTTDKGVMWIGPSNFWKSCSMRRSLFTLLLRTAENYDSDDDNYEDALFVTKELKRTKMAVLRFLFGFTKYTEKSIALTHPCGYKYGWYLAFSKKNKKQIRHFLVKPDVENVAANWPLLAGVNDICT